MFIFQYYWLIRNCVECLPKWIDALDELELIFDQFVGC